MNVRGIEAQDSRYALLPEAVGTRLRPDLVQARSSDARVVFDGESIRVGSFLPDRDLLVQAREQAGWVQSLLAESTGQRIDVKAVIVFPGWFVVSPKGASKDVWVLEPKALPAFLASEPARLSIVEVAAPLPCSTHIACSRLRLRTRPLVGSQDPCRMCGCSAFKPGNQMLEPTFREQRYANCELRNLAGSKSLLG